MDPETELKMLQDAWTKLWHTYITWFTWHFAIHVTMIAGFLSIPALQKYSTPVLAVVLFFAILGLGATIAMIKYQIETRDQVTELRVGNESWVIFGGSLTRYAGIATFLTGLVLVCAWTILLWKWPLP